MYDSGHDGDGGGNLRSREINNSFEWDNNKPDGLTLGHPAASVRHMGPGGLVAVLLF